MSRRSSDSFIDEKRMHYHHCDKLNGEKLIRKSNDNKVNFPHLLLSVFITVYANLHSGIIVDRVLSQTKDVEMTLLEIEGFLETVSLMQFSL